MGKYRFIEHMSDVIVEAEGKTFQDAFEALALGMFTQTGGTTTGKESFDIEATGGTVEEMVVNALSELLAEIEIQRFTPMRAEVRNFDEKLNKLRFTVFGETKPPKNIIKAVTFHQLFAKKGKEGWTLRVLFDI
jgi:SHS2 domain-containing protein